MIKLCDDIIFEDPQKRIREYCAIEVYYDYDDRGKVNFTYRSYLPTVAFTRFSAR
jgi:hypothetical protein